MIDCEYLDKGDGSCSAGGDYTCLHKDWDDATGQFCELWEEY